jgi:hypothetical protein
LESILSAGGFFGWVEPTPYFVGFRDTQSNLRSNVVLPKAKPNNRRFPSQAWKVSFFDQTGSRLASGRRSYVSFASF